MKSIFASALVIFCSMVPLSSNAADCCDKNHEESFEKLGLNEQQKKQIKEIKDAHQKQMKVIRDQKKSLHDKMKTAMTADASESDLKKIHEEMRDLKNK